MYTDGRIKSTRNDTTLLTEGDSSACPCRANQTLHSQLGLDNTGPMGVTVCTGVLSTANDDSHANGSTCRDGIFRGAAELDFSGNTNINSKGSGELTGTSPSRLHLPVVSGPQKSLPFNNKKEKKDGGFQPVVNLKALNKFIQEEHFKMEGFHMVRDLVRQGDWLAKIDLKDAYFLIPVYSGYQKFLQFT